MSIHFPDEAFDTAVTNLVEVKDIIYGFGPSSFHIEIQEDRDTCSVFGSADAEYQFYSLLAVAKQQVTDLRLEQTARNEFVMLASMFLEHNEYNYDVARWLAIANALIVGRDEYEKRYGYLPVETDVFVEDYMTDPASTLDHEY